MEYWSTGLKSQHSNIPTLQHSILSLRVASVILRNLHLQRSTGQTMLHAFRSAGKVEPPYPSAIDFMREVYAWPLKKTRMQKYPLG
jgi:hypothetical protein